MSSQSAVPGTPALAVEALSKRFGDVEAVADVTLSVASGEILGLLGPSGCGKSTFLRLVAGFECPDGGTVLLGGTIVAGDRGCTPPERREVGLVFQDYALFPHLTIAGNVGYGVARSARTEAVARALALVGLEDVAGRYPHEISGGQQQRVALARALAPAPRLVLLDEPFSNLDATLRVRVREEVRDILRRAGATAVFVTHDQEEALSLADRIAIMRSGRLLQVDAPERVYARPADPFVAAFVGGANMLDGVAGTAGVECAVGTLPLMAEPGNVTVALRPESVRLELGGDAVVERVCFYGHDCVVEVRLPDGTLVRSRYGPRASFEPGQHVRIVALTDEALLFQGT